MKFHGPFLAVILALTCLSATAWAGDLSTYSDADLVYFERLERDSGDRLWNSGIRAEINRSGKVYYSTIVTMNLTSYQMQSDAAFVRSYFNDANYYYSRANVYRNERVRRAQLAVAVAEAKLEEATKKAAALKWSKEIHFTVSLPEDMKDATVIVNKSSVYPGKETLRAFDWAATDDRPHVYEVQIEMLRNSARLLSEVKKISLKKGDRATRVAFTEIDFR